MSKLKNWPTSALLAGFTIGAAIPLFWGILGMLFFNVPEGWFSRAFWRAVYLTCPFWAIEGGKALVLMPLFNGLMYAAFALLIAQAYRSIHR
jgi:hypothetical protein